MFTDRRQLQGPLPAIASGAVVEEEHVLRDTAPLYDSGVTRYHFFAVQMPTRRARIVLDAPESLPLRYVTRLLTDMEPRRIQRDGRVTVTFEAGPLEPVEFVEPMTPSDVPILPYVAFTTGSSWRDVAARYHEIVEQQISDADLGNLLGTDGSEVSRDQLIRRMLARLRKQVRYSGSGKGHPG